ARIALPRCQVALVDDREAHGTLTPTGALQGHAMGGAWRHPSVDVEQCPCHAHLPRRYRFLHRATCRLIREKSLSQLKAALCEVVLVCRGFGTSPCAKCAQNENGDFDRISSAAASEVGVSIVTQRARVTRP